MQGSSPTEIVRLEDELRSQTSVANLHALTQTVVQVPMVWDIIISNKNALIIVIEPVILKRLFLDIIESAFARRWQGLDG